MASDAKSNILHELVAEFVEERVRQLPSSAFSLADVTLAVGTMLRDAGEAVSLAPRDDKWLIDWLNQHPFLLRSKAGPITQWKPGLNKGTLRHS